MKRLAAALLLTFLAPGLALAAEPTRDEDRREWIQLFDGKSLDGWVPKIAGYETGVELRGHLPRRERRAEGRRTTSTRAASRGRFGHLFYRQPFSHYVIRVEYRFLGEQAKDGPAWAFRNSGIMIHGQPPETMRKDQDFPISIEVQLLGGTSRDGQPRTTGNLCTPGTNVVMKGKLVTDHCVNSTSKRYDGEQWVTAEVEVHGSGKVVHRINGESVLEYEQPQIGGGNVANFDPAQKQDGKLLEGGLDLAAGGEPPGRVPQGGAAEPRRLHGPEGRQLQELLREGRPRELPVQVGVLPRRAGVARCRGADRGLPAGDRIGQNGELLRGAATSPAGGARLSEVKTALANQGTGLGRLSRFRRSPQKLRSRGNVSSPDEGRCERLPRRRPGARRVGPQGDRDRRDRDARPDGDPRGVRGAAAAARARASPARCT